MSYLCQANQASNQASSVFWQDLLSLRPTCGIIPAGTRLSSFFQHARSEDRGTDPVRLPGMLNRPAFPPHAHSTPVFSFSYAVPVRIRVSMLQMLVLQIYLSN